MTAEAASDPTRLNDTARSADPDGEWRRLVYHWLMDGILRSLKKMPLAPSCALPYFTDRWESQLLVYRARVQVLTNAVRRG